MSEADAGHAGSLVKSLLRQSSGLSSTGMSTNPLIQYIPFSAPNSSKPKKQETEDAAAKFTHFYNQFTGLLEKDSSSILKDHCYARPWNWRPESSFLRPTKTLFMPKPQASKRKSNNPLAPVQENEETIDVEADAPDPPPIYEVVKAKHLMEECDRYAMYARIDPNNEDWEENIVRVNWTTAQNRLYNGMVNILNSDYLARLAHAGAHNEPILRRTLVDKSVKRVRQLFANIAWDSKLVQWLHQLLIDNLSTSYLAAYFDILQTLKSKLPIFVDKILFGPNSSGRIGVTSSESLFTLLKRPWDPVASSLLQDKPKKLPGNPVIIVAPSAPSSNVNQLKRQNKWINLLSNLATVLSVHTNIGSAGHRVTMMSCADQMLAATRAKVQEIRTTQPGRPIVLAGFNAGAALALQVAQIEHVVCVICLGFSLLTAEGKRGDPDDSLLELQCPVLFVVGQCSRTSLQEDMENLRERMRVETGLIVVGSADDYLRVSKKKKRIEGITQSVVDRCIVDEVGEFVSGIVMSPYPPQIRQSPTHVTPDVTNFKRQKQERKRNNSNGSSIDSEPPSPTPRNPRRVGRPPGPKTKSKLEAKWNAHIAQALKMQHTITLNRSISTSGSSLSSLLQSNFKSQKQGGPNIKVLENLSINPASSAKIVSSSGRTLDLSKITVLNSVNPPKNLGSIGNVVLTPDGKIKAVGPSIKGCGSTPMLLPMGGRNKTPSKMPPGVNQSTQHRVARYITSKKQLIGKKPPQPLSKLSAPSSLSGNLMPPSNLTSQDIMDLPIIFADDNQLINDNPSEQSDMATLPETIQQTSTKVSVPHPTGKLIFVNKHVPINTSSNMVISGANNLKRPALSVPVRSVINPMKYTKIIISRGSASELKSPSSNIVTKISNLSPEISIRKVEPPVHSFESEPIDLEKELVATAVPKPNYAISDIKNVKLVPKSTDLKTAIENLEKSAPVILNKQFNKRMEEQAGCSKKEESPMKKIKFDNVS